MELPEHAFFTDFHPLQLTDRDLFRKFFNVFPPTISEYTFANLFMWRAHYRFHWKKVLSTLILISLQDAETLIIFPPIGHKSIESLKIVLEITQELEIPVELHRVSLELVKKFQTSGFRNEIREDRPNWDYVYRQEDLARFAGKRFQNIRKKINKFKNRYNWVYQAIDINLVQSLQKMQSEWCDFRSCEDDVSLNHENIGILELFEHWDVLELQGGAIFVDGKLVAYTIAERLNSDTLVIHVEKGNSEFVGVYQIMAQQFSASLEYLDDPVEFINREQDLGEMNLRRSKESYHPFLYEQKFILTNLG